MPHETLRFGNFKQDPESAARESSPRYGDLDPDIIDSTMTDSHLDVLRSMILLVIREIDALQKIMEPQYSHRKPGESIDLVKELAEIEKAIIKRALLRTNGNQAAAAKLLSIKSTTLHEKMKRYGIKTPIDL